MPNNAHLGFAGGFLGGLQASLAQGRKESADAEQRKQAHAADALKFFLDPNNPNPPKDIADLNFLMEAAMPEIFGQKAGKPKAGQPDHQQMISGLLNSALQGGAAPEAGGPAAAAPHAPLSAAILPPMGQPGPLSATILPPIGSTAPPADAPAPAAQSAPSAAAPPAATPASAGSSLLGVPVLSREEVAGRQSEAANKALLDKIEFARTRVLPAMLAADPTATLDDALAASGIDMRRNGDRATAGSSVATQSIAGELPDGTPTFGVFDRTKGIYLDPVTRQPIDGFRPRTTTASASLGVYAERAARALGYTTAAEAARAGKMDAVNTKASELMATDAQSRTEGAGAGKMNTPADFATSQAASVPVGTKPSDVVGQTVAAAPDRDRRKSVENLKTELEHIKTDLLGVLPKKGDLGDLLPGAWLMARRRMPSTRTDVAKLEAAVNNIVNVAARSVGEQKGAQTEQDAMRAEAAIVSLKDDLFSPTKGDTQESATARIDETLKVLETILSRLAPPVTPGAKPAAAAPAAAVPGAVMRDGKLYINGVLLPGQ